MFVGKWWAREAEEASIWKANNLGNQYKHHQLIKASDNRVGERTEHSSGLSLPCHCCVWWWPCVCPLIPTLLSNYEFLSRTEFWYPAVVTRYPAVVTTCSVSWKQTLNKCKAIHYCYICIERDMCKESKPSYYWMDWRVINGPFPAPVLL